MPTIATTEAFIVDGVATTALEQRLYDTAMFLGDGSNNGVRGGVVRHGDNSMAVTVNGSDQVTVQAGACVAPAGTGQGVWRGTLAAATSAVGIAARNSTNPRIDLVVAQFTGTSLVIKTIDGTPAASPTAPALPAQHLELARLSVPKVAGGAVTVTNTFRTYATGLGGILYVETAAQLPGSGNQKGQRAIPLDTGIAQTWNGTTWITEGAWVTTNSEFPNLPVSPATIRYCVIGKTCHFRVTVTVTGAAGPFWMNLPVTAAQSSGPINSTVFAVDTGTGYHSAMATLRDANSISFLSLYPAGNSWNATYPFTWANTDTITAAGTYEIA